MERITSALVTRIYRYFNIHIRTMLPLRPMSSNCPTGEGEGLGADLTVGEQRIITKLHESFPTATHIQVSDVSGGCGAMYQISIESPEFEGKKTVQQHRMVNQALEKEIKAMHGLQLKTKAPDTDKEGF